MLSLMHRISFLYTSLCLSILLFYFKIHNLAGSSMSYMGEFLIESSLIGLCINFLVTIKKDSEQSCLKCRLLIYRE